MSEVEPTETVDEFALATGEHFTVVKYYFDDYISYSMSISGEATPEVQGFLTNWQFIVARTPKDEHDG